VGSDLNAIIWASDLVPGLNTRESCLFGV